MVSEKTSSDVQEINNLWQAIANNRVENELSQSKIIKRLDAVDIEKLAVFVSGAVMQQMEENIDQVKLQQNVQLEVLRTQVEAIVQKVEKTHERELERLARVTQDLQGHLDLVQAYVDMLETQSEQRFLDQKAFPEKRKEIAKPNECLPQKLKERLHALMSKLGDHRMQGLEPELQQMNALLKSVGDETAEASPPAEVSPTPTKVYPMPQGVATDSSLILPKRAFAPIGSSHSIQQADDGSGAVAAKTIYAPVAASGASAVASGASLSEKAVVPDQLRHTWTAGGHSGSMVVDRSSGGHGGTVVVRMSSAQKRTPSVSISRQDATGMSSATVMPCAVGSLLPKCSLSPSPRATYAEIHRSPSNELTPRMTMRDGVTRQCPANSLFRV
jgi:hypothetical protein